MADDLSLRAEQLLTLPSAARRLADIIAAADRPLSYDLLRHLLRVSEEDMAETLQETIHAGLVRRADDPFTYVPATDAIGREIREAMAPERAERLRRQIAGASERVHDEQDQ
jgi:hypothetical protein